MKSVIFITFLSLISFKPLYGYGMGPLVTCWENNKFSYRGYHDEAYVDNATYQEMGGEGDVCSHTDPDYGVIRDMCYFQVQLGAEIWTYKCMYHQSCPVKDANGDGTVGCVNVTNKRITCCCQGDFCNGEDYVGYAELGYAENWTPDSDTDDTNKAGRFSTSATSTTAPSDVSDVTSEPIRATNELCVITDRNSSSCSCGGDCRATETEYFALVQSKCGDQILRTGQYGVEDCDQNNVLKKVGLTVPCWVLPCEEGEFKIVDSCNPLLSSYLFIVILHVYYIFVY
eukprot:80796_1